MVQGLQRVGLAFMTAGITRRALLAVALGMSDCRSNYVPIDTLFKVKLIGLIFDYLSDTGMT